MLSSPSPHLLVLGMNFPPEATGISPYTGAMAQGLSNRGFATRVVTAHPHYPDWKVREGYGQWSRREQVGRVTVDRVRHYVPRTPKGLRRLVSEMTFGARQAFARWNRPDVIVAVSPALVSSAIAALRARLTHRGTPLVVWVQDLYTLGLAETGQAGRGTVRVMSMIEGWLLRRADTVVVIHDRFAQRVSDDFGVPRDRIRVVRNWTHLAEAPEFSVAESRAQFGWADDETVVLHAGNMGVKQGLDNVVDAARHAASTGQRVRFVLLGAGSELERLKAAGRGIPNLQFLSPLNDHDFAAALGSADCLLVNELPGVSEMAVPSKLTSYFSAGKPVIAATDITGITADEIRAADAGVVVPAGDPQQLLHAVSDLAADPSLAQRLGANGQHYRYTVLDEESAINDFSRMLAGLIGCDDPAEDSAPDALAIDAQ